MYGTTVNTRVVKRRQQCQKLRAYVKKEAEVVVTGYEIGGKGHEPRNARDLWKLEKVKKWILL